MATVAEQAGPGKLGARVAARIEDAIREGGWAPDHCLGAEEQLAEQFGASRAVIREAIAIAEWHGVVERRRGREGGVFVAPLSPDAAVAALRNYLFLAGAGLADLLRARRLVEGLILERALLRMTSDDAAHLAAILPSGRSEADDRARLDQLKSIVERLAEVAGSPVLGLFGAALRHCYVDRVRTTTADDGAYYATSRAVAALRVRQLEAILASDRQTARDLQTRAMDAWEAFADLLPEVALDGAVIVERLSDPGQDALIYEFVRPVKKAEALARALAQTIANRRLPPGGRLGTEPELAAQFAVSRRALREGLRILEHLGVVRSERGMRGGLVVATPGRDGLAGLLERAGAGPEPDLGGLALVADLAADAAAGIAAMDVAGRARFARAADEAGASPAGIARALADCAGPVPVACFLALLAPALDAVTAQADCDPGPLLAAVAGGGRLASPRYARAMFEAALARAPGHALRAA